MLDWSRNPLIGRAAQIMRAGGVVAYPTEAVWGLGCDPSDQAAVARLLGLKNRSPAKGLILLAADMAQLGPLLEGLDDIQRQRLKQSWPGPSTWLIPHHGRVPVWICGGFESVAVRVTNHPLAAGLSRAFGGPIVSTSVNPQGQPPARNQLQVRRYFGNALDDITPGKVGHRSQPSEIRDLVTGKIVRAS